MRGVRAAFGIGVLAVALAACSGDSGTSLPTPSRAFCQAAYDYDTNLPKLIGKVHQQTELVQKLANHAPKDIAADAQRYLDAMKKFEAGDKSDAVVDNPKIRAAVDNVNRRASDGCDLFKQNQDGTGGM